MTIAERVGQLESRFDGLQGERVSDGDPEGYGWDNGEARFGFVEVE